MKQVTITSHELAQKLLAMRDLPVYKYPPCGTHDDVEARLIPLSFVEEMPEGKDEWGDPYGPVIIIDCALEPDVSATAQPNAKLSDAPKYGGKPQ